MQQFDITVANTGAFVVHAPGRYIKYLSGSNGGGDASLIVTPGGQGGSKIMLQPGQAYRISDKANTPDSWTLANAAGGATIVGKVVIGDGRIDDNTLSGVVQVVDGGKSRTMSNSAYMATGLAQIVTNFVPQIQLWNPAGSGMRLVLESIYCLGGNALQAVTVMSSTVALASLNSNGYPKMLGGTMGVGQARNASSLAAAPAQAPSMGVISPVVGSSATSWKPTEPIVIPPGNGLLLTSNAQSDSINGTFEWYEEPNV